MKFILAVFLSALLGIALGTFMPWWSIAIAGFLVAIAVPLKPGSAFLAGFTGIFVGWVSIAMLRDASNERILSVKIASILPLGGSSFLLIVVAGLVGALVGGFAALSGSYLRGLRPISAD